MPNLMNPTAVVLLVFAGTTLGGLALALVLRDLLGSRVANGREGQLGLVELTPRGNEPPKGLTSRFDYWFDELIAESGLALSSWVAFLMALSAGLFVGGGLFLWWDNPIPGAIGMLVAMGAVFAYFAVCRARRLDQFREQLPLAMDLMARAVRAGETLDQSIALVAESAAQPLADEFLRCSRQLDMGLSLDAALRGFIRRVPLTETRIFAAALSVQRRTGGNLPVTLERLAAVIRDRMSYRRQFRATTATGRTSSLVILTAAAGLTIYLFVWRPEYIQKFFESLPGQLLLGLAFFQLIVALIWISRLLNPRY